MSTSEPFLPALPSEPPQGDDPSDAPDESAAADSDVAAEDELLDDRSAQQEDPPFRTPEPGERLDAEDLDES